MEFIGAMEEHNSTNQKEGERDNRGSDEEKMKEDEGKTTETQIASDEVSREEINVDLPNLRGELDIDIEILQNQIDNCHDDQLEDLEKQMMELLTLREELYPSDKDDDESIEHNENNGVEVSGSEDTKNNERSYSKSSDENVEETTFQPMVIQEEQKIKIKFENKLLGMNVVKRNNKL